MRMFFSIFYHLPAHKIQCLSNKEDNLMTSALSCLNFRF
jgi:hypothetical protein